MNCHTQSPRSSMRAPLGKELLYSGVLCAGIGPLLYYFIQKGLSRTEYYQMALEQLHSHTKALEALGSPLTVHRLPMLSQDHSVDINSAQLKIPVSGPKAKGHLYTRSSRGAPFQRWHLQEVILKLQDGQQIPVFRRSEAEK
ncbi:cytochrome c oxidase assembly factor 1 homolog isoform X2 [Fukomys damarensis]|uniref:cytochrome c oxidase assembly factor 1 homolog isoform X2 n=1 Tax=Fukomys damarensis TaxID=885580 RepID=UPI00053FCA6F|nr:cytochrome c oxidase assembly factor 1 homolog isoform X2 [Fukomys damarensis]